MRIFVDHSHYDPHYRKQLHTIPKAFWNTKTEAERQRDYGQINDLFELVDSPEQSDLCLLPMAWNYYLEQRKEALAQAFAERARLAGKQVIVWSGGDFGVRVPFENAVLFQCTIQRSQRSQHEYAAPPVFADNAEIYGEPVIQQKGSKPIVGFCGQVTTSLIQLQLLRMNNIRHALRYTLGRTQYLPMPIEPASVLRAKVLNALEKTPLVETNFILHQQYKAGVKALDKHAAQHPAKRAFINNLNTSNYIVCVRGAGNWSKRFYEALNWGRIPVFIDTDCVLPFDFAINWKDYCVWIDQQDIALAGEIVADFHARLSPKAFSELQHECRKLWQERLSSDGFYTHFYEHFAEVLQVPAVAS